MDQLINEAPQQFKLNYSLFSLSQKDKQTITDE